MDYLPLCRNEEAFFLPPLNFYARRLNYGLEVLFSLSHCGRTSFGPPHPPFPIDARRMMWKYWPFSYAICFIITFKFAIMWRERATSKQAEWENDLRSTDDAQENTSVCAWMLSYAKRYYLRKIYAKNKVSRHKKVAAWTVRDFRNSNLCNAWFMDVKRRGGRARLQWRVPVFRVAA